MLARYCDRTLWKLDPPVRRALRMGVHGVVAACGVWGRGDPGSAAGRYLESLY